jgi:tyrosyl-tRNA synthetase
MSIPDSLIIKYFRLLTDISEEQIKKTQDDIKISKLNPRDAKLDLAFEITKIYHGEEKAQEAKEYFVNTFSKKETPENIPKIKVEKDEIKLTEFLVLAKTADSISDARRKIEQGGVEIDGKKVEDWKMVLDKKYDNSTLKVGKINFIKIKF